MEWPAHVQELIDAEKVAWSNAFGLVCKWRNEIERKAMVTLWERASDAMYAAMNAHNNRMHCELQKILAA